MKSVVIGFFLSIPMAFAMWGIVDLASATEDDISSTGLSSDFCYVKVINVTPTPTVTITLTPTPDPSITETPEISPSPTIDFTPEP